jgi:hypothetical protein
MIQKEHIILATGILALAMAGCHGPKQTQKTVMTPPPPEPHTRASYKGPQGKSDAFLTDWLKKYPAVDSILARPEVYEAQVIYTRIDRDAQNTPKLTHFHANADAKHYFYPASMVKMPLAILALQRINELRAQGIAIDRNSTMITETAFAAQTPVYNDATAADGQPSIAHYIKKIFLVSDNDASNRLYEFLGQDYVNSNLQRLGLKQTELLHRLSVGMTEEQNRHTNPVVFYDSTGKFLYRQEAQYNNRTYSQRNDKRGNGFLSNGKLVSEPLNFSNKNRFPLEDMLQVLTAVIFPDQLPEKKRFLLTEDDLRFLRQYMSQWPSETTYPTYEEPEIWDNYVKFNLLGSEKDAPPKNIRIFNKVGEAYGYLTDVSYIVDFENNIEFILSATIYVNSDGIFNDDKYDYDDIGFPFFKNLGQAMYDYEKSRSRKHIPDLSAFRMVYDK